MRRRLALALLVAFPFAAARAQGVDELRRLRDVLAAIQLEQQSLFQQFQMVQGLRASQSQPAGVPGALVYTPPSTPPNFDDLARERDAYAARQSQYRDELERLYARYRELEERKRPIVDRIAELASTR